ncbi:MAG: alpha/beta hydrolase [Deltaproteobacteria bacterium]|nr:alpha/beta hydrolase [Deltaproteobacteria bacterium]
MRTHLRLLLSILVISTLPTGLSRCSTQPPDTSVGVDSSCDEGDAQPGRDAGAGHDAGETSRCRGVTLQASDLDNYATLLDCLRNPAPEAERIEAVSTFITAVESHDGLPIVGQGQVVFVYVRSADWDGLDDTTPGEAFEPGRRNLPIRVAGDFNSWNVESWVLRQEAANFFHVSVPISPTSATRWGYKLIAKDEAGNDVWFSDPLSRRFVFDASGRLSIVRGDDDQGQLEWIRSVHARRLNVDRSITLYLPRGYDTNPSKRYPVLYMHDGNNLFDAHQPRSASESWEVDETANAEIEAGRVREFIVVGIPNNDNRLGEYTPVADEYEGSTVGGDGELYADFIVSDLKPLIDGRYRTLAGPESTAVLGSSLGGVISFFIGLEHPQTFKYIGGMSSTFDWGSALGNPTLPDQYAEMPDLASRRQVYYLDSGGGPEQDGTCPSDGPNDGRDNYCETLEMKGTLEAAGISTYPLDPNADRLQPDDIDIYHWWQPNAPHSEASWRARMFRPLRLFFRP